MDFRTLKLNISRSENLPIIPTVILQILRLFNDPNVSPRSLEKIIEQDPALTAKILKVGSSSMYGSQASTTVGRALSVMGINAMRSLAISVGFQQVASTKRPGADFDRIALWKHALAVGIASRQIMRLIDYSKSEEVYIAGLMHEIGILAIDRYDPLMLTKAIHTAKREQITLCEAEVNTYGYDHAEVGGFLAEHWKLDSMVHSALLHHNDPAADKIHVHTTRVVGAADALAYRADFPAIRGIICPPTSEKCLEELALSEEKLEEIITSIRTEVEAASPSKRAAA